MSSGQAEWRRTATPVDVSGAPEPVRLGIMSTALINEKLLAGAALTNAVVVPAVASRDATRAASFADRWAIRRRHASYEALLADDAVEAVYIPLPNAMHHEWTMRALQAGRHVLCEKPYSRSPAEVAEAFTLADSRGLILSEAFMYRYHPQTVTAHDLVRTGTIGALQLIVSSFSWPNDQPGTIRTDVSLGGGSLMDVGVYPVNAARLFAGEPTNVTAQQVLGPTGVDTSFVATMSFQSGVLAHLDSGFGMPERSHLELVGSHGRITVNDPWHCRQPGLVLEIEGQPTQRVAVEQANPYRLELEAFALAVRGLPSPALGRADALGQARTVEALYASAARRTSQAA